MVDADVGADSICIIVLALTPPHDKLAHEQKHWKAIFTLDFVFACVVRSADVLNLRTSYLYKILWGILSRRVGK